MSINKAFVVKNGFEVSTNLILANADTGKVGIATTSPQYTLHVAGGIGVTDAYVSGIGTFADELNVGLGGTVLTVLGIGNSIGIGTALPQYLLDIRSPVSTGQTALYVQGDVRITGDLNLDDVTLDDAVIQDLYVTNTSIFDGFSLFNSNVLIDAALNIVGLSTFNGYVDINNSVDVSNNLNVVGLTTLGGYVDINNSVDVGVDLNVVGLTTLGGYVDINDSVDVGVDLNVVGLTTLGGYVDINDSVDVSGTLNVVGVTTLGGYVDINNSVDVSGAINVVGLTTLGGYVDINDSVDVSNNLNVVGLTTLGGYVDINNSADISGTLNVVGVTTLNDSVDIGVDLNVVGLTTLGGYVDINDSVDVSNNLNVSGVSTFAGITTVTGTTLFTKQLNVSGISTLGTVKISSGIITASSGIVTYYGNGQYLDLRNNPSTGIGIRTTGSLVGFGITFLDLKGAGVSTTFYDSSVGIATIFFEGGGSGTIGIGTEFPTLSESANGDLFYSVEYGRIFVYYDEDVLGIGTDAFWVDAAPFNVGIITSLTNVSFAPGSATSPSMFFIGDNQTGFFSPTSGQFTIVSTGASVLNVNPSGIRVTGIVTATDFDALSDENYKENVITVNNALNKVEQLRGVSFDWKDNGRSSYGVIAQELQKVLPELVHGEDPKTVNYNGIIGVLIEAVKELSEEVKELKRYK